MQKAHVVIQTAFIGDLFLAIPLLHRLKKKYPEHKIILVCKKGLGEFFLKMHWADEVHEVEKGQSHSYRDAVSRINQCDIDHVYCLHRSFRSALFSFQIKARHKIGFYSSFPERLYKKVIFNSLVKYPKKWPDVIRQMSILTPKDPKLQQIMQHNDWSYLNVKNSSQGFESIPEVFQFPVVPPAEEKLLARAVALFPGSVWATKKWTHEGYAAVARALMAKGYQVYIMGAPGDLPDAEALQKLAPGVNNLTGQMSLYESSMYVRHFDLVICNDSAPSHIAASFGRPVLCIFGPTVLDFGFRPWNNLSQVIELDHLACRPCGPHGHAQCPLGHHDCMKKIDFNKVTQTALNMLGAV